ncbi:MAG: hypothetical protein Q4P05_06505 [Actinomycetaceae bacterium]|nr:hypothetical protein [Actinomycetaceae bacterium]
MRRASVTYTPNCPSTRKNSSKRQATTATFAFVGLTVRAGFTSGQKIMQYFVGCDLSGLLGGTIAAIVFAFSDMVFVQLGSHLLANDHNAGLSEVSQLSRRRHSVAHRRSLMVTRCVQRGCLHGRQ